MASTSSTTTLGRYRPVVLTICGAAAAFSIFQIYKASQTPPGPGLRRQPAIHRHRRASRSASPSPQPEPGRPLPAPEIVVEDVETVAETDISNPGYSGNGRSGTGHSELTELLYHIGENRARETGYVHRGVTCDACGTYPIRGIRWHCLQCEDFDLCSDCEAQEPHIRTHVFSKIKIPAPALTASIELNQPAIYPGYPGTLPPSIPADLRRKLHEDTALEVETLDALFDQFSCLTTIHAWHDDPTRMGSGIDRASFDKGFFAASLNTPKHNLVYDRYFAFFDSKDDGIIDFEEYATAVAIHTTYKGRNAKLKAIFDGYDIDGDGFVNRKDFLRMLRSYFALQRMIVQDALKHEEGLSLKAMENHLASAQPLGAVFKTSYDHRGDPGRVPDSKSGGDDDELALSAPLLSEDRQDGHENRWDIISHQKKMPQGALKTRWRRRRFYTDEEEGQSPPDEWDEEEQDDDIHDSALQNGKLSPAVRQTPEGSRPASPRSRSSSKVRFKDEDDQEFDTRSNASSSSRPIGERWGGYEIPADEQDLGTDILYQVTQQGLNELLDDLLLDKETMAEQVKETRKERTKWAAEIHAHQEHQKKVNAKNADPLLATASAVQQGRPKHDASTNGAMDRSTSPNTTVVVDRTSSSPDQNTMDEAIAEIADSLPRMRTGDIQDEMDTVEQQVRDSSLERLLSDSGYTIGISRLPTFEQDTAGEGTSDDMLPHLRPSTPELERLASEARNVLHRVTAPSPPLFVPESAEKHPILRIPLAHRLRDKPDAERLDFYTYLNACEKEIQTRGGEGRIGWEEFRSALADDDARGSKFGFLEDWIRVGQI